VVPSAKSWGKLETVSSKSEITWEVAGEEVRLDNPNPDASQLN